ncbi:MAG: sodium:calcium symporter [Verrucomicrobia bacterium CG_4_10_14_3_um_filter_43_23]|nr:MAG: sodium:calcium symporter [Verrucomicrobia bacterium CG1_02_43_26]PIP59777.1 MAG: sodium:calcium symporter [Verrucomicrobia bacterium CG22_combo_CG10-13_8_21_14_all_43_17]PIX57784.1 MAG: sodium:calcium symporter [Verrucomicrobia bacterium CG_4_10_14_3_um_filter_43_23]PIY60882.1 MAG: sodium:calcium symporter [Verrucomicrobia bacterium CG_4_10_14_0_8_um_filter_43_34]PJA43513.1 MAG: sodium:calcium symporter [Verrucomicrobia bacterium CG_4_9_14_3_um_filter_43_20]
MATSSKKKDGWGSSVGVIFAVAGSAVGLANFLRFPGNVAQFGGGAFMLAYFVSLLVIALPVAWAEWTLGRYGGQQGYHSCPGILFSIGKKPIFKYLGLLGVIIPLVIFMYYVYVEAWCLGYAVNFALDNLHFGEIKDSSEFWLNFVGAYQDGSAVGFGVKQVGIYLLIVFALNMMLIYRGISKGIEVFCRYALPTLIVIAIIVLIKVMTLGTPNAAKPMWNIENGLGFMWNPTKVYLEEKLPNGNWTRGDEIIGRKNLDSKEALVAAEPDTYRLKEMTVWDQLRRPKLWLIAASQVFFSLSVGFGIVLTYSSYMKKDDDVVLSSLSAASANEFAEVGLGGLISIPAAYAFLGAAGVMGQTLFGLGFNVLPMVFSVMPLGALFGFLFFFLLFLAGVNAAISTLQPGVAFLEENLNIGRKRSVAIIGTITLMGASFVIWFSKDLKALDSLNFWAADFLIYVIACIQVIIFGWIFGIDKGFNELHRGAAIRIPNIFKYVIKYLCPLFLLTIFALWLLLDVFGLGGTGIDQRILDLTGHGDIPPNPVAWMSVGIIVMLLIFMGLIVASNPRYKKLNY